MNYSETILLMANLYSFLCSLCVSAVNTLTRMPIGYDEVTGRCC
jgi:glutaredoxin-related protein